MTTPICAADLTQEFVTAQSGVFTLGGSIGPGFQPFSASYVSGNIAPYKITDGPGGNGLWETGYAQYTSGTLTRTAVISCCSGTPSNVYASGAQIFCDFPAATASQIGASGSFLQFASGSVSSNLIAGGAIYSGHFASGQINQFAFASGCVNSGAMASGAIQGQAGGGAFNIASGTVAHADIGNGQILSGNIGSGQIGAMHLASGLVADFGSGSITSGALGASAVNSINISSGAITFFLMASGFAGWSGGLTSGAVQSGYIANKAVVSGSLASGIISQFALASGAVNSGQVASGAVLGRAAGGAFTIASGSISTLDIGSGAIVSGLIGSGQIGLFHMASGFAGWSGGAGASLSSGIVTSGYIGNAAVLSGSLASGSVSRFALASGAVNSGHIGSGAVLGQGAGGAYSIASGSINNLDLGQAVVLSGTLASGVIGLFHMASGFAGWSGGAGGASLSSGIITSGYIGNAAVLSGNIGSGQIGVNHLASGLFVPQENVVYTVGGYVAAEAIASGAPISLNSSGLLQTAMASISGRMPAFAVTPFAIASGGAQNPQVIGRITFGTAQFSGYINQPVYVSRSGTVALASGGLNSGGFAFTDYLQILGVADTANTCQLQIEQAFLQGSGFSLTSGCIVSGYVGNAAVLSGNIGSGQIGLFQMASGFAGWSGGGSTMSLTFMTAETVSGLTCVSISSSGLAQVAMAHSTQVATRMPAIGLCTTNALSGQACTVSLAGWGTASGLFSGVPNSRLWVGGSGQLVTKSQYGSTASGDYGQLVGCLIGPAISGSTFSYNFTSYMLSGGPISAPGNF